MHISVASVRASAVNLLEPHAEIGARVNEMNVRLGRIFEFAGRRAPSGADIYNILNAVPPLSCNQSFIVGGSWLTPTSVLSARFAKISAQFDFQPGGGQGRCMRRPLACSPPWPRGRRLNHEAYEGSRIHAAFVAAA